MWRTLPVFLMVIVAACGTARRGPPVDEPLQLSVAATRGQSVFMLHCHQCHPGGEAGLGFAINNKPLPRPLMAFQVRHGLGAMPAFPEEVISDPALEDLLTYLEELRQAE